VIRDQRRDHRVAFFLGADLYLRPDGEKAGRAVVRDLSVSGMRLEALAPVSEGKVLYVDFELAGRYKFQKVPAEVRRVYQHRNGFILGLVFQEPHDRRRLREALSSVL
jgi:hypothetical protein